MEIHLIRHTTPAIEKGICYGQSDIELKENAIKEEFDNISNKLPVHAQVIYTSPLKRCVILAEHIKQLLNIPFIVDERLKELNFGKWEMQRWNDINPNQLNQWMNNYENERCPEGESYQDLVARVKQFFDDLKGSQYQSIIVITHAGVIKSAQVVFQNLSLKDAMSLSFGYGSIKTICTN